MCAHIKQSNPNPPRTTLYNLGDEGWSRIFYNLAKQNQRERMFEVAGKHTFFFPVDSAFEVDTSSVVPELSWEKSDMCTNSFI